MIETKDILNPNSVFYDYRVVRKQLCDAIVTKNEKEFDRLIELLRLLKTKQEVNQNKTDFIEKTFNDLSLTIDVNVFPPRTTLSLAKTGRERSSKILSEEKTPLYHAIESENDKATIELLTFSEIDVNKGYAALQWQFSMQSESDPSSSTLVIEKSPLYLAIEKSYFEITTQLITRNTINVFTGFIQGENIKSLVKAAEKVGNINLIKSLLEAGAGLVPVTISKNIAEALSKENNLILLNGTLPKDYKNNTFITDIKQIFTVFLPELQKQCRLPENLRTINVNQLLFNCNFLLSEKGSRYLPKNQEKIKTHRLILMCLQKMLMQYRGELTLKNTCLSFFHRSENKVLRTQAKTVAGEDLKILLKDQNDFEKDLRDLENSKKEIKSDCSLM